MKTSFKTTVWVGSILILALFQSCSTANKTTLSSRSLEDMSYPNYKLGYYYTEPERSNDLLLVFMQGRINYQKYNQSLANAMIGGFFIAAEKASFGDKLTVVLVRNRENMKVFMVLYDDWQQLVDNKITPDQFISRISEISTTFAEIREYASRM